MDSKDTSIVEVSQHQLVSRGEVTPARLVAHIQTLMQVYRDVMIVDTDYGIIKGTKKPSLYQPGAQLLRLLGGLGVEMEHVHSERDLASGWTYHSFICRLRNADAMVIAECEGSANSYEDRYRFRWVSKRDIPRGIDPESLPTKTQTGRYNEYTQYRVENDNLIGLDNTLVKIAQKRAFVGAALMGTGASRIFTQDVEDTVDPAETTPEMEAERPQPARKAPVAKAKAVKPASPTPEPEQAAAVIPQGKVGYSQEPGSVLAETKAKVIAYMNADATGLKARNVVKAKGWELADTSVLSELQAQTIIAVCEGRDEADVMAP